MEKAEIEPINLKLLQDAVHTMMLNGVKYRWGSKPALRMPVKSVETSDCSGFTRYVAFLATSGEVVLPEGSYQQHDFLAPILDEVPYQEVAKSANEATLYLCFIHPTNDHAGHVWFVCRADTFECYGGHGVGSRHYDRRPLPQEVTSCFIWPHIWV
jgi:hypothetical protein